MCYVGHAQAAINIPWSLWTGKWDDSKKDFVLVENPNFVGQVKERFKTADMILVMCRSGERSSQAVDTLRREGFGMFIASRTDLRESSPTMNKAILEEKE